MADKLIAEYKQKEFERLRKYVLNQLSIMECNLNPQSQSRKIQNGSILIPSENEVKQLNESLLELRANIY
ncbi:hypothetical protein LCGC14_0521390 [marine sediment metagenome]|uniref:Uncharacterized protein n=1 Tax=marine sediment metagenome TaxID=412755 RepID=A0A0F9S358_9ZZZZ